MNNQAVSNQEPERICRKCERKLPKKSDFCMYCGTDNATTSVQNDVILQNNDALKKYKVIETHKRPFWWYLIFMLLVVDVIFINYTLMKHTDDIYVKVNAARFQDYEKAYHIGEYAYLAVKGDRARIIGDNRAEYIDATRELQKYKFRDVQQISSSYGINKLYLLTTEKVMIVLYGSSVTSIELINEYDSVYEYLNAEAENCPTGEEFTVLRKGVHYYNIKTNEVYKVLDSDYNYVNESLCKTYKVETKVASEDINIQNPKLVYQQDDGELIILKGDNEILIIEYGAITERIKEFKMGEEIVKVEDIKQIFYESNNFLIINKKDHIFNYRRNQLTRTTTYDLDDYKLEEPSIIDQFIDADIEDKLKLIALIIVFIADVVFLYKMNDKHMFTKTMSLSGVLMIEFIVAMLIATEGGIPLNNGKAFLLLMESLFLIYLAIILISVIISQMAELAVKILDLISFRNIFSYFFVLIAIAVTFLNIEASSAYGVFFATFVLGSYWSYFTEVEDIDVDLFITMKNIIPMVVLFFINVVVFLGLINMFHICNSCIVLLLLGVMFGMYLAIRPELTRKELTGKTIKSLIVMILYIAYTFISTLFTMNLFSGLVKDYEGELMKEVLLLGATNVLYLAATFAVLIIISTILRILHKIIKKMTKKTNTITTYFIFSIITMILFTIIIFYFPEIINAIDTAVAKVFGLFAKE